MRRWFEREGVLEVDPPTLVAAGVTEPGTPSYRVFPPLGDTPSGYLSTSPEYHLKRLVAAGLGDVYAMAPVFRAEEVGRHHQSEFVMVEWYRVGCDLAGLIADVTDLVRAAGLEAPVTVSRYRDVFAAAAGIDPITASDAELAALADATAGGIALDPSDRALSLDLVFSHLVAPGLGRSGPEFIRDFPACQAALARLDPATPETALRTELFVDGLEIANGFEELTDAREQRARFEADNRLREARGLPMMPIDEPFLAALEHGLPPCAGVALGLDRLLMVLFGATSIGQVRSFADAP